MKEGGKFACPFFFKFKIMLLEKIGGFMSFDKETLIPISDIRIDTRAAETVSFYYQSGGNAHDQRKVNSTSYEYTDIQKGNGLFCTDKNDFLQYINETFNVGGGGDISGIEARVEDLENKIILAEWYEEITINSTTDGASATITAPANAEFKEDGYGNGTNAIIYAIKNNRPIEQEIRDTDPTTGEEVIAAQLIINPSDKNEAVYTIFGQLAAGESPILGAIVYKYIIATDNYDYNFDLNEIPVKLEGNQILRQKFIPSPTNEQTIFNLPKLPLNLDNFVFDINGQSQKINIDFTVSGTTLIFLESYFKIDSNDQIFIEYNF